MQPASAGFFSQHPNSKMAQSKLVFIVATKDRPDDLHRMFESLQAQTRRPDGVIVVDSSREPVDGILQSFLSLHPKYIRAERPSASGQRNAGIRALGDDVDFVGFLDDDATLEPDAIENMMHFWSEASPDVGGASFNFLNPPPTSAKLLKKSQLCMKLGLYSPIPGRVMPSGWQTLVGTVGYDIYVDWLATGAAVWRREVIDKHSFDPFFDGYSYLEDLDFSYSVRRHWRLAIVADAGFCHYPGDGARNNAYAFGRVEARNRLYFVRKHHLSTSKCYLGIGIRMMMTLREGCTQDARQFLRACGNVESVLASVLTPELRRNVGRI